MSTPTRGRDSFGDPLERSPVERAVDWLTADTTVEVGASTPLRVAALACIGVVTAGYLSVLYFVVSVVGGVELFLAVTGGAVLLAFLLGAVLSRPAAFIVSVALLAAGLGVYLTQLPEAYVAALTPGRAVRDTIALLTGYSVLQLAEAGAWAIAVAPGPTFLAWYFAARGEYVRGATVGGLTLGFFVLTGDAGIVVTLAGVLAAAGAAAFGTLARLGAGREQVEALAAAFAVMILASAVVSAVPGGGGSPLAPQPVSVEADLVSADDRTEIAGGIRLSPKVRFVVDADRSAYWRVAAYDRFTGSAWVQTGTDRGPTSGILGTDAPGPRQELVQRFTAKATLNVLPAAAEPTRIEGLSARINEQGTLELPGALYENDSYVVTSFRPDVGPAQLNAAGRDYPESINRSYLQLPSNTPDRVTELTANITETADSPYETAVAIERWLEANKEYSLHVQKPEGNIADKFLFELQSGYCVYFATTMVTMLRSQGIPARYVVGYTPGQQVAEDTWVVRGYDSHAWVEVYFPDVGWVKFDPTPAAPRRAAEQARLASARSSGAAGIDTAGSEDGSFEPTTTATTTTIEADGNVTLAPGREGAPSFVTSRLESVNATAGAPGAPNLTFTSPTTVPGAVNGSGDAGDGGQSDGPLRVPPLDTLAVWSVLVVGLAAGARRSGVAERAYRAAWVRVQPRDDDPAAAIEGAFARVEYVLGRRERERRDGETVREYLDAIDAAEPVREVAAIRERARYAGTASAEDAERARRLAAEIVRWD